MKIKSHSGTKKRIKVRKSGKLFVGKASRRHLLSNKNKRQKAAYSHGMAVTGAQAKRIRRNLPV